MAHCQYTMEYNTIDLHILILNPVVTLLGSSTLVILYMELSIQKIVLSLNKDKFVLRCFFPPHLGVFYLLFSPECTSWQQYSLKCRHICLVPDPKRKLSIVYGALTRLLQLFFIRLRKFPSLMRILRTGNQICQMFSCFC